MRETPLQPLSIRGIKKTYGDGDVLSGVSLDVEAGEFVTLLGPSGSGKTSLLNVLAGFIQEDSGSILLGDQEITKLPPNKRNLGYVFQHYALFPHLRVVDNVAYPLLRRKVDRREARRRANEVLELVGLSAQARRKPSELSGGQQQRVALARAIVFGPSLLLMDEPLGALDLNLRARLQREIRRVHRETGTTVVYVTHDQGEAFALSDRIAVLADGQVEGFDTPQQIFDKPATRLVAEFLGYENLLIGKVGGHRDRILVNADEFRTDDSLPSGSVEACVAVRSDRVQLIDTDAVRPPDLSSAIACTVREVVYQGDFQFVYLRSESGTDVTAKQQIHRGSDLRPGDSVIAAWGTRDQLVYPKN